MSTGVLAQFTDPVIVITEGQLESLCVELFGVQLARNVALSLELNTNEGTLL